MKKICTLIIALILPVSASADSALVDRVISNHVIPRFRTLAQTTAQLAETAAQTCDLDNGQVVSDYHAAFDAWVSVSHLRFGPTEVDDRAFALAFWPDPRSKTTKALHQMISSEDPVIQLPENYAQASIAVRGFYAMEYVLFDEPTRALGHPDYQCALFQAMTKDTAMLSQAILDDWQPDYAALMLSAGQNERYQTDKEAVQELFKAALTGFQFTKDTRIGRPLGTFDKPRPKRAEARRSGRSLRNVVLATDASLDLARQLGQGEDALQSRYDELEHYFTTAVAKLESPVFAGVSDPQSRVKVEVVQQAVDRLLEYTLGGLGPHLGVAEGFNALDGD
ncbi:imelysin family protein [Neptunicoccus cionae]|uniref:Signal peptidase n=1 Tax=Neptunicoccus cionae TaxID=2035344 RepID=A0A916QZR7_9RHOB|nr:imelysin family protein [Amylibacter cionae]GGA17137.1 signal peptidase [Amylibacter cionae]